MENTEEELRLEDVISDMGTFLIDDYLLLLVNDIIYSSNIEKVEKLLAFRQLEQNSIALINAIKECKEQDFGSLSKYLTILNLYQQDTVHMNRVEKIIKYVLGVKRTAEVTNLSKCLSNMLNNKLFQLAIVNYQKTGDLFQFKKDVMELQFSTVNSLIVKKFSSMSIAYLKESMSKDSVISSAFPTINSTTDLKGYLKGSVVAVAGAPGCLVGSTVIRIGNKDITLEELYNYNNSTDNKFNKYLVNLNNNYKLPVYSCNLGTNRPYIVFSDGVQLTKYVKETVIIDFGSSSRNIECTLDHQWYVSINNKSQWVRAIDIVDFINKKEQVVFLSYISRPRRCTKNGIGYTESSVLCLPTLAVKNAYVKNYEKEIPVYDVVNSGAYHNFSIVLDKMGTCVISHNSGKSNFLMYEAYNMCVNQGKKGFWLALGDLLEVDIVLRFMSIYYKLSRDELRKDIEKYFTPEFQSTLDNLEFSVMEPGTLSIEAFYDIIERKYKDGIYYDFIVVDYDENFSNTLNATNTYQAHNAIYNLLGKIAKSFNCLVFVASQIKNEYQNHKIIPTSALAESSKKQNIIDMSLLISRKRIPNFNNVTNLDLKDMAGYQYSQKHQGSDSYGYINKGKDRRGISATIPYISSPYHYEEMTDNNYNELEQSSIFAGSS